MGRTFGFLFFMLFLAAFALVMLQGRQTAQRAAQEPFVLYDIVNLYGQRWRPTTVDGDPIPEGTDMFVTFSEEGEVNGFAGCNNFFGTMEETDGGFDIGPLGATRRACEAEIMGREMDLFAVLDLARNFNASVDALQIVDDQGNVIAEFDLVDEL